MDWRDIPSLPALRAVEATARTGSFSAAARELNVTHAAIAQHVRAVEDHLGVALLVRAGRGLELTDLGAALAADLTEGFGTIVSGVQAVTSKAEDRPLSMTVTPSFAENWLMPRLGHFWAAHPEITLSITPSLEVVDLRRETFDLGIRYGYGSWPGVSSEFLVASDYVVAASPSVLGGRKPESMNDLRDLPWIFESNYSEPRKWAIESGLDLPNCQVKEFATLSMVMAAVRAGAGVSILSRTLIETDVAEERLVPLFSIEQVKLDYYIVTHTQVFSPRMKALLQWLRAQAKSSPNTSSARG